MDEPSTVRTPTAWFVGTSLLVFTVFRPPVHLHAGPGPRVGPLLAAATPAVEPAHT